jgi:N-acylglucosamine-6-phosphate 2-epimerase
MNQIWETLRYKLIVSCQPDVDEPARDPLNQPEIMAALALSAVRGGAAGIRADSPAHIAAVRKVVAGPIIGIYKKDLPGFSVRITPTTALAVEISRAGADIIAIDATDRPRPEGRTAADHIRRVVEATGRPVLADISSYDEALAAADAGAEAVATTLSGYTDPCCSLNEPDYDLVSRLAGVLKIPVMAEGRFNSPVQAARALECGAWAVTVGSAITRPRIITSWFAHALEQSRSTET